MILCGSFKNDDNNSFSDIDIQIIMDETFNNNTKEYNLIVPDGTENLSFSVETASSLAVVTGADEEAVPEHDSVRTITITAENGDTNTFTINVFRPIDLQDIEVPEEVSVAPNGTYQIDVTYVPINADQRNVTYTVNDPQIVSVDSTGLITATDTVGETTITVTSQDFPSITKTIHVTVEISEITSSVYEIRRDFDISELFEDAPTELQNFVYEVQPLTTLADFIPNFDNDATMLHVYDLENNEVIDEEAFIGSGMVIKLEAGGRVYDELPIVVFGDTNGDGLCDSIDLRNIKDYIGEKILPTSIDFYYYNVNRDEFIDSIDLRNIKHYIGEKIMEF